MRCAVTLMAASLLGFTVAAGAATYLVRPDGSGDFPTIQAAIAGVAPGDTVALADGTFRGIGNRDINFMGKAICVQSRSGDPNSCSIDCEGSAAESNRAFAFVHGERFDSIVQGVMIRNGYMGMLSGGAVYCVAAAPTFMGCTFQANRTSMYQGLGGAVACLGAPFPRLVNCHFVDNEAAEGGAIYAEHSGGGGLALEVVNCAFYSNLGGDYGGAISCRDAALVATDCLFEDNSSHSDGGGAVFLASGDHTFVGCTFHHNFGGFPGAGAGIRITSATARVSGCTFVKNYVAGAGAAIWLTGTAHLQLAGSIIAFNSGGSVRMGDVGPSLEVSCSDIRGNSGGDWVDPLLLPFAHINGNFSADPCFCDLEAGDFHLWNYSPCNQAGLCGQIGAWPVGCTEPQEALEPRPPLAGRFVLRAAPNPFTTTTTIDFTLPAGGDVRLHVLDSSGRLVRALVDGAFPAGPHRVPWNGLDDAGRRPPSGAYYCRLEVDGSVVGTDAVVNLR